MIGHGDRQLPRKVTVELGFSSMNTPEDPAPDVLAGWLEERGFESFWVGEHPHIPTSRKTPYPAGGDLPPQYLRMMDPFVSLTAAACATERLLIGIGVALPLEHDLFDFAKSVATLDRLSGGRLQLGVGVGWNEEELANHRPDIPWSQRYRALAECIGALRALWADDESEFHGRFYDFDPVWSYPKPLQRPHPPILCGTGRKLGYHPRRRMGRRVDAHGHRPRRRRQEGRAVPRDRCGGRPC